MGRGRPTTKTSVLSPELIESYRHILDILTDAQDLIMKENGKIHPMFTITDNLRVKVEWILATKLAQEL